MEKMTKIKEVKESSFSLHKAPETKLLVWLQNLQFFRKQQKNELQKKKKSHKSIEVS